MPLVPVLYRETRVASSPTSPARILHIHTDSSTTTTAGRKRAFDQISGHDESTFALNHLATEGSVYFRRKQRSPCSFLWRVLDDRKILDIQCVDVVHDSREEKAGRAGELTYRIHVPAGIVKNGVAFADPDDTDALEAFVLTASNEVLTITLKRDILTRDTIPNDFDASSCVQKHSSSSLSFRHPYKLVAPSNLELLVSLHDGGILRLTRQQGQHGSRWHETIYSEGNWGDTIRGLISLRRHQTVPYGDSELDAGAIAAMVKSPDGRIIWTVTLDHQLKAWSSSSGKPIQHIDLLNERQDIEQKAQQKYLMNSEPGSLLQVVVPPTTGKKHAKADLEGTYFLVVRSPKNNQFKFFKVAQSPTEDSADQISLHDTHPTATLIPPLDEIMDTSIWHLEDFSILPGTGWHGSQLWLRARNGKLCRTFVLTFDLLNRKSEPRDDLEDIWQSSWATVHPALQNTESLDSLSDFPHDYDNPDNGANASERWLRFLFHPSRFSYTSIETALNTYRKGRALPGTSGSKVLNTAPVPLQQRLMQAISSKVTLSRYTDDRPDYARYQVNIQAEWNAFYSLLRDLHARRNESISLGLDAEDGIAWSVCADFSAPIRTNSQFEALEANVKLVEDDETFRQLDQDIVSSIFPSDDAVKSSRILAAAKAFTGRLSAEFLESFADDATFGAFESDTNEKEQNELRVQQLFDVHHFNLQVMDDDFEALESAAEYFGGLGNLGDEAILGVLEWMQHDVDGAGTRAHKALNGYGDRLTMAVAQETLQSNRRALLSLLMLVVFVYGDLDRGDLDSGFVSEIGPVYEAIIVRLKHNEMLSWLAENSVVESQSLQHGSIGTIEVDQRAITLLQRIFIADWDPRSNHADSMSVNLTKWTKQWAYGPDVWEAWDGLTGHIMAFLIKEQSLELATDFNKFLSHSQDSSVWLRYLEGRLLLATGQYAQAGLSFQAAAEGMAEAKEITAADSARLLSAEERNYFGDGQSRFYQHVSSLFEKLKIFSYAADFARIALDHLESGNDAGANSLMEIDRQKAVTDSPAHQRASHALNEIDILKEYERRKEEIRIRLFTALVETGRFPEALDALAGITERPIRNANLSALIKSCIDRDAIPTLLDLPFDAVNLSQEADTALLALAKKSLASSSSASQPYHQILYAYRTQHANFQGAAEILYEHLQRLKYTQTRHGILDPEEETLVNQYVLLINTLACCGEDSAWLLADPIEEIHGKEAKRKLVTIADVRKEYSAELDKRSDVLLGRFPLLGAGGEGGEAMDVL